MAARPAPTLPAPGRAEAALLAAAGGDREAFGEFYELLAPRVFGLVRSMLGDEPGQCEPLAREVFIEAWCRAPHFDPASSSAASWVLQVAHRIAVRRTRENRHAPHVPAGTRPADALHLAYYGGHTHSEVSSLLGLAPGAGGPMITRALRALEEGSPA